MTYYAYSDPISDPRGNCSTANQAILTGVVRDALNLTPIENVSINITDQTTVSNINGSYSMLIDVGTHILLAGHIRYYPHFSTVNLTFGVVNYYNFTMTPSIGLGDPLGNGTIIGFIKDSLTGVEIANVSLTTSVDTDQSAADGSYSIAALQGLALLIAQKEGYRTFSSNVSVQFQNITGFNFNMTPDLGAPGINGTGIIQVYLNTSASNVTPIPNTTISIGQYSNSTNASGGVRFTIPSANYSISAVKDGHNPVVTNFTIVGSNTTFLNITMNPSAGNINVSTGTLSGNVTRTGTVIPVSNATVIWGPKFTKTSGNGTYEMNATAGEHYVVIFADTYVPHISNVTVQVNESTRTIYNVNLSLVAPPETPGLGPGQGPGSGVGVGPGLGPGKGPGTGSTVIEQPNLIDVYLSVDRIKKKIRQGTFAEALLTIYNFKQRSLSVDFSVLGDVESIISLKERSATIAPNSSYDIRMKVFGNLPIGDYFGSLRITGDGYSSQVPIEVSIISAEKLEVKSLMVQIKPLDAVLVLGKPFRFKVDLINLLSGDSYDVYLEYSLSEVYGNTTVYLGRQDTRVKTFTSVLFDATVPGNLSPGDFVLSAQAHYLNVSTTASTLLRIRYPFWKFRLLGVLPMWMFATILGVLLIGLIAFIIIKREIEKRKRFHVKVDYKTLPKEGARSLFVGVIAETTRRAYLDMDLLTVHSIVAGSTGGGKSIAAQDIVEECLLHDVAVVVFDPTAQWSGMLRKCTDKKMLSFYAKMGINVKEARAFPGNIRAVKDGRELIDLMKFFKPGEIQVFTTSTLDPKDYDVFVANTIRQIFHSNLQEYRGLRCMLVYDEIHRILPKFGGSGEGFVQIERGCREFRKWGIGILLISQVLQDFVGQIKANINTNIQMKTRDEGDLNRIKEQYGESFIQELIKSPVGSGMIQNSAWNNGRPYYITFRPIYHSVVRLSDDELDLYNEYNDKISQLEYELEQLEKEHGQDVFDLRLELKLALDKVKSGNFNMVKIYLEGLTPRIEKAWVKVGAAPKKLEVKLIDVDAMKKELEKAKEESARLAAADKKKAEEEAKRKAAEAAEAAEANKKYDPAMVAANKNSLGELLSQMEEAIESADFLRVNDLKMEVEGTIRQIPKEERKPFVKKLEEKLAAAEAKKNAPKEQPKPEGGAGGAEGGAGQAAEEHEEEAADEGTAGSGGDAALRQSVNRVLIGVNSALRRGDLAAARAGYSRLVGLYALCGPALRGAVWERAALLHTRLTRQEPGRGSQSPGAKEQTGYARAKPKNLKEREVKALQW